MENMEAKWESRNTFDYGTVTLPVKTRDVVAKFKETTV